MLHSDYSDYALLYNSLIALPKSDCFQVKPNKLQKSAGVAHMLKMQHHNLLIFIFFYIDAAFQAHYERWRSCDCFGLSVCLLAELLIKSWVDLHELSEFMLSPAQSGWLFESAVVCMHKCLKLFFMMMSFKHRFANIVTNSDTLCTQGCTS